MNRRDLLNTTTAIFGVTGLMAACWPLIGQLKPDARTRARDILVDLAFLEARFHEIVYWEMKPVYIVKRTKDILSAMGDIKFVSRLFDPYSSHKQQPVYACNWHRSKFPEIAILAGTCTYCQTLLQLITENSTTGMKGGYTCPLCASQFDPAGRVYFGPAQLNLLVPPHDFNGRQQVFIGHNPPGEF